MFTPSGFKDIMIRTFEFMVNTSIYCTSPPPAPPLFDSFSGAIGSLWGIT